MSEDLEARLLDLELRLGNFLMNTADKFEEARYFAAEATVETATVINAILEELIAGGALDRNRLIHAMEAHSDRVPEAGRSGMRRLAVDSVLSGLRRAATRQ